MKYPHALLFILALLHAGMAAAQTNSDKVLGENWELRSPKGTSQDLTAIAVNGSTNLVSVGLGGAIIKADTPAAWSPAVSGVTTDLLDVIWSDAQSQYVAVGAGNTILTSADGATWAKRTPPTPATTRVNAVVATSATGLFAVGGSATNAGLVLTSNNAGATWAFTAVPGATTFKDVVYTGTKYVAVCSGKVFTSATGAAPWVPTVLAGTVPTSMAYVPGAGAAGTGTVVILGNKSWSSTNGGTWTAITPPSTDLVINAVVNEPVGANAAVVELVGANGDGEVWSSTDAGKTWQIRLSAQLIQLNAASKVGDSYVVVGDAGVVESSSGTLADSLQRQTPKPEVGNLASIASNGSSAVTVGAGGKIVFSSAFETWTTNLASPVAADLARVIWSGTQYVAVGAAGSIITSPDGSAWTSRTTGSDKLTGVAWNGTMLVAVGENAAHKGICLTSPDGVTWTPVTMSVMVGTKAIAAPSLLDVTNQGTSFVAIASGYALRSTEGTQWTAYPLAGTVPVRVAASATKVIITGNKNWSSANGSTWTSLALPAAMVIDRVNTGFVGVSSTGAAWLSNDDGGSWQPLADAESAGLSPSASTLLSDGHYVFVGKNGLIETFKTGLLWDPFTAEANGVAWNGKNTSGDALYVAVGWDISWTGTAPAGSEQQGKINWVPHRQRGPNNQPFSGVAVIYSDHQFVAVGTSIWTSPDGVVWTEKVHGPSTDPSVYSVAEMDGKIYAFAYDSNRLQVMLSTSADHGDTWTSFVDMPGHRWAVLSAAKVQYAVDATHIGAFYLAVGWGGRYLISLTGDANTWSEGVVPGASNDDFTSVVYSTDEPQPVATTINGAIWTLEITKTGIIKWNRSSIWKRNALGAWAKSADNLASHTLWCVQRSKTEFIAAGNYGFMLKSFNGFDWREYPPEATEPVPTQAVPNPVVHDVGLKTPQHINSILFANPSGGEILVAVGGVGTFLSSDGTLPPVQPTITFSASPSTINEAGGTTSTTVTATLNDRFYAVPLTVPLVFSHANLFNPRYKTSATSLSFKATELTRTFTITAIDDAIAQDNDVVSFTSGVTAADFRASSGSVVILDDEPEATFDIEASTLTEGAPDLTTTDGPKNSTTITVTLAAAPTKTVFIPLDYSASTAPSSRYTTTAPAGVTILAGNTSTTFTIGVVNDGQFTDNTKNVVVKLWGVLDVSSTAKHVHTVTFVDNDTAPTISTQPLPQLVPLGSQVTFVAAASGGGVNGVAGGYKARWLKNDVAVADQETASYSDGAESKYTIPVATTASAGVYKFQTTEPGVTTSDGAKLAVVDTAPQTATVKSGGTVTISAQGSAPDATTLSFQWKKNGAVIVGATSASLTLVNVTAPPSGSMPADDVYTCTVSMPPATLDAGAVTVKVISTKPVVTPPAFGSAAVGADFSFTAAATPGATRWTITGLPTGLSYNSFTGLISGRPARAGSFPITFVATNAVGNSAALRATLVVTALPVNGTGTFVCILNGDGAVTNNPGGRIDLTITTAGTFTGKLTEAGSTPPTPLAGNLGGVPGTLRTASVEKGNKTLALTVDGAQGTILGTLTIGSSHPAVKGWRQTAPTAAISGYYTCALGGVDQTVGSGYQLITIGTTGVVTISGKLADTDATGYTLSTVTGPSGQIGVYSGLASNTGSIVGELDIIKGAAPAYTNNSFASGAADGKLYWFPTLSGGSTTLTPDGGRYIKPAAGQRVMGLPATTNNAKLAFVGADLADDPSKSPDGIFTVKPVPNNAATPPAVNVAGTALAFTPDKGEFFGTFTDLVVPATPRNADFYGVLIRPGGSATMVGKGFFRVGTSKGSVNLTKAP